jgi:hypothetical protein
MNFSITNAGTGTVTAGSGYTNGYQLYSIGGTVTTAPAWTNPAIETQIVTPTQPIIYSASSTVLGLNNASTVFVYGGIGFQLAPSLQGVGLASTGFITAPTVGGQNDFCYIQAF